MPSHPMYKAVNRLSGEEYLVLHPKWRERRDELRAVSNAGLAVCQSCQQPVRLKAGRRLRMHFAHLHQAGCSAGHESSAVIAARAVLFDWVNTRMPGKVEAEVLAEGFPRTIDVVIELADGSKVAWWVVDRLMRADARGRVEHAAEDLGFRLRWIMLERILRRDDNQPGKRSRWRRLRLSPCERACLRQTVYDEIGRENRLLPEEFGSSLYYLSAEDLRITGFRSLERVQPPNIFVGREECSLLKDMDLDAEGEILFAGEARALRASRQKRERHRETVTRWLEPRGQARQRSFSEMLPAKLRPGEEAPETPERPAARCVHCGEISADWWTAWEENGERLGKCRSCLEKGLG